MNLLLQFPTAIIDLARYEQVTFSREDGGKLSMLIGCLPDGMREFIASVDIVDTSAMLARCDIRGEPVGVVQNNAPLDERELEGISQSLANGHAVYRMRFCKLPSAAVLSRLGIKSDEVAADGKGKYPVPERRVIRFAGGMTARKELESLVGRRVAEVQYSGDVLAVITEGE